MKPQPQPWLQQTPSGAAAGHLSADTLLHPGMADILLEHVLHSLPPLALSRLRATCSELQRLITPASCQQLGKQRTLARDMAIGSFNPRQSVCFCQLNQLKARADSQDRQVRYTQLVSPFCICRLYKMPSQSTSRTSVYSLTVNVLPCYRTLNLGYFKGRRGMLITAILLSQDRILVRYQQKEGSATYCRCDVIQISSKGELIAQLSFMVLCMPARGARRPLGVVSRDGTRLVWQSAADKVHMVSFPGGDNEMQLQIPEKASEAFAINWSPANGQLSNIAIAALSECGEEVYICVFAADTGSLLQRTTWILDFEEPKMSINMSEMAMEWAPDGSKLAICLEPGIIWLQAVHPDMHNTCVTVHVPGQMPVGMPICRWEPSSQLLACCRTRIGTDGCIVHATTGYVIYEWGWPRLDISSNLVTETGLQQASLKHAPELLGPNGYEIRQQAAYMDVPELSGTCHMPAVQQLFNTQTSLPSEACKGPRWLQTGSTLQALFIPALRQVISLAPAAEQTRSSSSPSSCLESMLQVLLSDTAVASPCGRWFVVIEHTQADLANPVFHYVPATARRHHLGIRSWATLALDNANDRSKPCPLPLTWITDLAASLVYACIGPAAIFLVDGATPQCSVRAAHQHGFGKHCPNRDPGDRRTRQCQGRCQASNRSGVCGGFAQESAGVSRYE